MHFFILVRETPARYEGQTKLRAAVVVLGLTLRLKINLPDTCSGQAISFGGRSARISGQENFDVCRRHMSPTPDVKAHDSRH